MEEWKANVGGDGKLVMTMKRPILLSMMLIGVLLGHNAVAGKLGDFEADASRPGRHARHAHADDDLDTCVSVFLAELFWDATVVSFVYGGANSLARVGALEVSEIDVDPRRLGEPGLSFARLDVSYQHVASDIDAGDIRMEAGYGPVAVHADWVRFWEDRPAARLDVVQVFGLYRMTFGSTFEVDFGVGSVSLEGDGSLSRAGVTLPILVHPHPNLGVELRPMWADRITDIDAALLFTAGPLSIKAGYRGMFTPNESLHGPYAGLSVRL